MNIKARQAIRERVEKATGGPWTKDLYYIVGQLPEGRPGGEVIGELRATRWTGNDPAYPNSQKEANADFVAHARRDIPDLLDALEEALGLLKEVPFQFEPLLQDLSEEHYLDDDVHEALDKQLKEIEAFLTPHGAINE